MNKEARHVLQEDVAGSHLANHTGDLRPEPAVIILSVPSSSKAPRLTRETCDNQIDSTSPGLSIEGEQVSPDWRGIKASVSEPGHKNSLTVGVFFDIANRPCAGDRDFNSKIETCHTGTE